MAELYSTCEEIPLYNFIEMYKGNLKALVKKGKAEDSELKKIAMNLIDEYSIITGNKNVFIEIDNRSRIIDYNIKLILLEAADYLINTMMYIDASEVLQLIRIKMSNSPNEKEIKEIKKIIQSKVAQIKYNKSVLERNKPEPINPKDKDFTKERMIISTHFKMRIDPYKYTAAEYGNMIKIMFDQLKEIKSYGK